MAIYYNKVAIRLLIVLSYKNETGERKNMKKRILLVLIIVLLVFLLSACQTESEEMAEQYKAKVFSITDEISESGRESKNIELEIMEGPYEGQIFTSQTAATMDHYKNFELYHVNDRVLVNFYEDSETGEISVNIMNQVRAPQMTILFALFLAVIVAIAGKKGLKTIVALVLTIACVGFILIPMISKGKNPILAALLCGVIISSITLSIVGGVNRKTLSAVLGTLSGLVCAAILTMIVSNIMHISGETLEDVEMIVVANIDFDLDIQGIITAGIFIGCLGAVMDVGMSLASSMVEVKRASPKMPKSLLFKAGMRVGRDIMGTMANTLILAYTGGALMQLVAWKIYGYSFTDMMNVQYIAIEVVRAICGSFGMLLSIPITCLIAANIINIDLKVLLADIEK